MLFSIQKQSKTRSVLLSQFELLNQLRQGCQLLFFNKFKFINEEYKMLKASIEMVLKAQCQNHLKMRMINMCIYSKKSFENSLYHCQEIFWKRYTYDKKKFYRFDMGISLSYQTDFPPMSQEVQYIMELVLSMEFLHFAHLPKDTKIFDQHSQQGKIIWCNIQLKFHRVWKFNYRTQLHQQLTTSLNLILEEVRLLNSCCHYQVSFELFAQDGSISNFYPALMVQQASFFLLFQLFFIIQMKIIPSNSSHNKQSHVFDIFQERIFFTFLLQNTS